MVDTRDALYVGDAAQQIENPQYVNSWQVKEKE
jgi:homogentisate 1,2-dioxygenase